MINQNNLVDPKNEEEKFIVVDDVDDEVPQAQISESFDYEEVETTNKKKGKMKWMMQSVMDYGTKSQRTKTELGDGLTKSMIVKDENSLAAPTASATPKGIKNLLRTSMAKAMNQEVDSNLIQKQDWQKRPYCQICYVQFSRLTMMTPHHCRMCGRTCCYYCSQKRQLNQEVTLDNNTSVDNSLDMSQMSDSKGGVNVRICDYCEVKLNNPQLEKFYELGKTWRKRENEIVESKLNWYQQAMVELNKQINEEQESIIVCEMNHSSEKSQINLKTDQLLSDKLRISSLKKNIQNDLCGQILENQQLDQELEDLQQQRTMMMLELDKVMNMYDEAEQEKCDIINKIQVMQGLFQEKENKQNENDDDNDH